MRCCVLCVFQFLTPSSIVSEENIGKDVKFNHYVQVVVHGHVSRRLMKCPPDLIVHCLLGITWKSMLRNSPMARTSTPVYTREWCLHRPINLLPHNNSSPRRVRRHNHLWCISSIQDSYRWAISTNRGSSRMTKMSVFGPSNWQNRGLLPRQADEFGLSGFKNRGLFFFCHLKPTMFFVAYKKYRFGFFGHYNRGFGLCGLEQLSALRDLPQNNLELELSTLINPWSWEMQQKVDASSDILDLTKVSFLSAEACSCCTSALTVILFNLEHL